MKKTFLIFCCAAALISCSDNNTTKTASPPSTTEAAKPADPDAEKGLAIVAKNDCFGCHKIEEQATGPAYTAVAGKYPNNQQVIDSLAQKIIKGGAGNWGTIPMTAHPTLSKEDASLMVHYILSLKK